MSENASVLRQQLYGIEDQIESAKAQLAELSQPDQSSPEVKDTLEAALKQSAVREENRVLTEGLNDALATLQKQQTQARAALTEAEQEQSRKFAKESTLRAIAEVEGLVEPFNDAVQALKDICQKLKDVEARHGDTVRKHLADLKRADRPYEENFRFPHEKLVEVPEIALPELKRVNGADNSPIRWYGDIFKISYGEFFQVGYQLKAGQKALSKAVSISTSNKKLCGKAQSRVSSP